MLEWTALLLQPDEGAAFRAKIVVRILRSQEQSNLAACFLKAAGLQSTSSSLLTSSPAV